MKQIELVARLLKSESTLALATTAADGSPRTAPVFYLADDELCLYWFSSASSQHSRNLKRDAAAAVAVYRATDEWDRICGVQMHGSVAVAADPDVRRAVTEAYVKRFRLGALFRVGIRRSRLYRFTPSWVRYIDNSKRFGYKFELTLAPHAPGKPGARTGQAE